MVVVVAFLAVGLFLWNGDARSAPYSTVALLVTWGVLVQALPKPKIDLRYLLLIASVLRGLLCLHEPSLSDDVYRYLWEGNVFLTGGNPYVETVVLSHQQDSMSMRVNHPQISSVYPPVAMMLFTVCSWLLYEPLSMQLCAAGADILLLFGLCRLMGEKGRDWLWLYALHPLPIVESASSGHLESIALAGVVWAIVWQQRGGKAHWWLFFAGGVKLLPFLMLPAVRNLRWRDCIALGVVLMLLCLPFWSVDSLSGLRTYAAHWSFNGSVHAVMHLMVGYPARWLCMGMGVVVCVWVWASRKPLAEATLWIGAAFVLLSPTVHPWYGLWVWVPAIICRISSWNLFVSMLPLSYVALASLDPDTGVWSPPIWPSLVMYICLFLSLLMAFVNRIRSPGPSESGRRQIW